MRSAGYAMGSIAGPVLGGILARPVESFPGVFGKVMIVYLKMFTVQGGLFAEFPYLLPCIISALISLLGFVTGYFFLKETNPNVVGVYKKVEEIEMEDTGQESEDKSTEHTTQESDADELLNTSQADQTKKVGFGREFINSVRSLEKNTRIHFNILTAY
jgi:hypothetical protein